MDEKTIKKAELWNGPEAKIDERELNVSCKYLTKYFHRSKKAKQRRFLAAYAMTAGIRASCRITGIDHRFHYFWLDSDETYAELFQKAHNMACDLAEEALFTRGTSGYSKPVTFRGEIKAWYKDFDTPAVIAWLRANRAEKYRESLVGFTANAPVAIQINLGPSTEQKAALEEAKGKGEES